MSDFYSYMLQVRLRSLEAQSLFEYLGGNSEFPQGFVLPESCSGYNFHCLLIRPVEIDGCKITKLSISRPPGIDEGVIETALLGPDGLVYPSELGYDDVCRHESRRHLLCHLRDLAQKLSSYA